MRKRELAKSAVRNGVPLALIGAALRPGASRLQRAGALGALFGFWSLIYARYRKGSKAQTHHERELLKGASWEAFWRHYNERVPTIEEEFEMWGAYHQHRHEMRYDLVADEVRKYLPPGGRVLDVGCGSALVADRIRDMDATYVGFDFGGHHIEYAAKKYADITDRKLGTVFARGDGAADAVRRCQRRCRRLQRGHRASPAAGARRVGDRPRAQAGRRARDDDEQRIRGAAALAAHAPVRVAREGVRRRAPEADLAAAVGVAVAGRPAICCPRDRPTSTCRTRITSRARPARCSRAAGLDTFEWSTFEFPPPQAAIRAVARQARRAGTQSRGRDRVGRRSERRSCGGSAVTCSCALARCPIPCRPTPPPGVWPGPFSSGD